ncbi:hypothetical protein SLE2022_283520 [Rubroshorea leprosula]
MNLTAIHRGEINASKEVRKHFKFPEACSTVEFEVSDELGDRYTLKAKRRMKERCLKEAVAGLKTYIRAKDLVQGVELPSPRWEMKLKCLVQFSVPHFTLSTMRRRPRAVETLLARKQVRTDDDWRPSIYLQSCVYTYMLSVMNAWL